MNNRRIKPKTKNAILKTITMFCFTMILLLSSLEVEFNSPFFGWYVFIFLLCCAWLGLFALANNRG